MDKVYIAIDLGASSGRVIAAEFQNYSFTFHEIHRFSNVPLELPTGIHWNLPQLYSEILHGLSVAAKEYGSRIVSLGIDTWGCDFALLSGSDELLGLPHHYRDPRQEGMAEKVHERISEQEIFKETGVRTLFFNTSVHLYALKENDESLVSEAKEILFTPDLLCYWLSGEKHVELSIASTSQLLNPATGQWSERVIRALGLPEKIFGELIEPGTIRGTLRPELAQSLATHRIPVVAIAGHDTASAVAGIPLDEKEPLWLSSGTWSIIGTECDVPNLSDEAFSLGFSNERTAEGKTLFLSNVSGLWLLQECRRQWQQEGEDLSFEEMAELAAQAAPFSALINPDDPCFVAPGDMPQRIQDFCQKHKQVVPRTKGEIVRIVIESLALLYRERLKNLEKITQRKYNRLSMGGGGIHNTLLCQATADALGIEVVTGPAEATAYGNVLLQMIARKDISNLAEGRQLVKNHTKMISYNPQNQEAWKLASDRFVQLFF